MIFTLLESASSVDLLQVLCRNIYGYILKVCCNKGRCCSSVMVSFRGATYFVPQLDGLSHLLCCLDKTLPTLFSSCNLEIPLATRFRFFLLESLETPGLPRSFLLLDSIKHLIANSNGLRCPLNLGAVENENTAESMNDATYMNGGLS